MCVCVYLWVQMSTVRSFLKASGELLEALLLKEDSEGFLTFCSLVFKKMNAELQFFILFVLSLF